MRLLVAFKIQQQKQKPPLKILNVSAMFESYEIHFLPVIAHLTSIISAKCNAKIVYIGIALVYYFFFSPIVSSGLDFPW